MTGPTQRSGRREAVKNLVGGVAETRQTTSRAAAQPQITATIRHIPVEVSLGKAEGMPRPCVVNCDNLRTISKVSLVEKISRIPARRVPEVKRAVGYALAWQELIEARE